MGRPELANGSRRCGGSPLILYHQEPPRGLVMGLRTLVAEDDPHQRRRVCDVLTAMGLDVVAVQDAERGLVEHLRSPFDLFVIDWVMPIMDGLTLCQRVRALPGGDCPYVLVVTGRDQPSDIEAVLEAGADDYIAKPVDADLLRTRIRIAKRRVESDARHREAKAALARSHADFHRVIERSPMGAFAHHEGRIVYVNAAACHTLGAAPEEILGKRFSDFVDRAVAETATRRMARFERTQVPPPPIEMDIIRGDGTVATARIIPATAAAYQGQRACFTILEDVTKQRAAERTLRTTQFAVDHAADAAFWIHADGHITYANHAACTLCGHSRAELVGRQYSTIDTSDPKELFARGRIQRESTIRRRDGSEVPVEIMANVVDFDGDRFVIAFARDLTERQRLQQGLARADRLASVGALAAGVAHEINNPLAYVIANLELLNEEVETAEREGTGRLDIKEIQQTLSDVTEGTTRVRHIVHDLKSFARSESDDVAKPVVVHEVLDVAIDIARNEIRHRAQLVREYADLPPTLANEGRLTQVFLNLLVNAAHAIPENGRGNQRITIRTRCAEGGWIEVDIEDTGAGIPKDVVDRIFDPFFTTKPQGVGTGLGLSICHGIVTALGGEIVVESLQGSGTCFTVRLQPADGVTTHPSGVAWPAAPSVGQRSMKILVVDDEPLICEGIRRALSGHQVVTAASGLDAIRNCESEDYELVICDVMMPDVSGMEVFDRVRRARPEFEERFVFMTGGAFTPRAREFLESVDNEQIIKPFSLRELRNMVARHA